VAGRELAGALDGDGDGGQDVLRAGPGLAPVAAVAQAVAAGGFAGGAPGAGPHGAAVVPGGVLLAGAVAVVPPGLAARATRTASSGTPAPGRGQTDITHSSAASPDSRPRKTGPGRHNTQPDTKTPGRLKS